MKDLKHHPLAPAVTQTHRLVSGRGPDWRQVFGVAFLLVGAIAVLVAWYGISGTVDPGEQMPYLISGGIGGAAAIAVGTTLLVAHEHARDRAALHIVLQRVEELERRLDVLIAGGTWDGQGRPEGAKTPSGVAR